MKKFFLLLLAAICAVCVGAAVACSGDNGEYYSLVFRQTNGVTYNSEIPTDGVEVRAGTEVKFSITLSNDATGEPVVYKNDEELSADADGNYSFVIEENTVIKVLGVDAPGGEYNRLLTGNNPGVEITFSTQSGDTKLQNGMLVKNGTKVDFSVSIREGYYIENGSVPVVKANDTALTAESTTSTGWTYSFIMNGRTEINVENVTKNITLTFVSGNSYSNYFTPQNAPIQADQPLSTYKVGETVKFKVQISVYYDQENFEVRANSNILSPDDDGVYSYTLRDTTEIKVEGEMDPNVFSALSDGGNGTRLNPFRLRRPVDIYQMAAIVNDTYFDEDFWREGYYVLENDIDLKDNRLYTIGTQENDRAIFSGHFDGKGHTISNFYIEDRIVEQENFTQMVVSNVGMFGTIQPVNGSLPSISNLTLKDYTIHADSSQYSYNLSVGSFVGMGYGVSITNCVATQGRLDVTGGIQAAYVGGIIGQQVSAYSDVSGLAVESSVVACRSDVTIHVPSSSQTQVYAAGGITGLLGVGERSVSAYVLNSYFTGTINGGLHSGGVVGYASDFTSVVNCYSAGTIRAHSPFTGANVNAVFYNAYAAGVVSELGYDAIVYGCFSTSTLSATSAKGSKTYTDPVVNTYNGGTSDEHKMYGFNEAIAVDSYGKTAAEITQEFITNDLHWNAADWKFEGGYPVINEDNINAERTITVSFEADGDFGEVNSRSANGYMSLAQWGKLNGSSNIPEYMQGANADYRSYGYFFDVNHEKRVPLGFVPMHDITLYIGTAKYADVAGTYYLDDSESSAMITFYADGTFFYRNRAVSQTSTYTYDGENITLFNAILGELTLADLGSDPDILSEYFSVYYNFGATLENGVLSVVGGYVDGLQRDPDNPQNIVESNTIIILFPEEGPLHGLADKGLRYGEYYANNGNTVYGFNGNGTGYRIVKGSGDPVTTNFTFVYKNDGIEITYAAGGTENVTYAEGLIKTVNSTDVKPYDGFTGVWEAAYGIERSYEFDGLGEADGHGTWKSGTEQGTYSVAEGVLTDSEGTFTAKINDDGFIEITKQGTEYAAVYYREGSFKGEWFYSGLYSGNSISVDLIFEGIREEGYGVATASYASGAFYELNYETVKDGDNQYVVLYLDDLMFASLSYNSDSALLSGNFAGRYARFTAYDMVAGTWITDDDTIQMLNFNGGGFYDLKGDSENGLIAVRGNVQVNGSTKRLSYSLDRTTMTGKFEYNDVEYTIKYNPDNGAITVTPAQGEAIELQQRDEWYGVELENDSGVRYVFDGMGRRKIGGKVTVYNGDSPSNQGTYKIDADGTFTMTLEYGVSGEYNFTITTESKNSHLVYVMKGSSVSVNLYRNTPFDGKWVIGTIKGKLEISQVYADNTATGSYTLADGTKKDNVAFTYYPDGNYMSFTYDVKEESQTYYLNAIEVVGGYNLSFGPDNAISGANNYTCIPDDGHHTDSMYDKTYYVYDRESGENTGKFVFDGLGNTSGTAILYGLTGSDINYESILARHTYTMLTFGHGNKTYAYPMIMDSSYEYLIIPCTDEHSLERFSEVLFYLREDGYSEGTLYGTHYYAAVYPDELYALTIRDGDDPAKFYNFDGVGGVTEYIEGGQVAYYTYTVDSIDSENGTAKLTFTDEMGINHYTVTLNQSSDQMENWTVTFDA